MNILLLGDGHIYGYGLSARQLSYTGHFVRQLSRAGRAVTVEAYAHLTLPESTAMLARLPLSHYDLIVLQFGPDILQRSVRGIGPDRSAVGPVLPVLPPAPAGSRPARRKLLQHVGTVGKTLLNIAASVAPAVSCPGELSRLLTLLRPYRHAAVLMTPFPCRASVEQWTREQGRSVLLEEGAEQTFSIFDTGAVVQPRDEYFLTGDDEHLNAVGHELIGRALFDFYQSAPTIVTVQNNRN